MDGAEDTTGDKGSASQLPPTRRGGIRPPSLLIDGEEERGQILAAARSSDMSDIKEAIAE